MFRPLLPSLLLALLFPAMAAEKPVARPRTLRLTLHKAIELALAKNFSLEAERLSPEIARQGVVQEQGVFDPVFDIRAEKMESTRRDVFDGIEHFALSDVRQTSTVSTGFSGETPWGLEYDARLFAEHTDRLDGLNERYGAGAQFGVAQPLLRGGGAAANLSQLRIARNNVLVSEWDLRQRIIEVITDTVAAYNELHRSQENFRVATGFRDLARQLIDDNTKRVNIGVMSPLNITTARAEAAAREEAVIVAARDIKDNENFLKQLITRDLEGMLDLTVEIDPPPTPGFRANVPAGIADALQFRPDYRRAILEIERRKITLAFSKNQALPRFDLSGSLRLLGLDNDLGTSFNRAPNRDGTDWTVGAIFSVPIPNRQGRGSVAEARLLAAQSLVRLQTLEQQIVVDVDNASGAVTTARQRIESTAEARILARESLDAGEERLRAGTGTTFEVLELQKKLAEAEFAELRARTDYNKAVSVYYRQVGTSLREHHVLVDAPKR